MKRFLYLSLLSSFLCLSLSPNAKALALANKSNECVSFYKEIIQSQFVLPNLKDLNFFETKSNHGTRMLVIDLAQIAPNSVIQKIVSSYFDYVHMIFHERLTKFGRDYSPAAAQYQHRLDSLLAQRSILVLDTPNNLDPRAPAFNGGVRVTYSQNPGEMLPFQYEFPELQRYNSAGTAVEVGRLTSQPGTSPGLAINLIKLATQVALQDPNLTEFYVHTSRIHARLYRLMGLNPTDVYIINNLNYVLRFTAQDGINWLRNQQTH